MHFDFGLAFGLVSGVLGLLAFFPYMRDTIWGDTRPLRATWLVWTALSSLSFLSNISEGATTSLFYIGGQTAATALIFVLSIQRGMGSLVRAGEGKMLALVMLGLALWWVTHDAIYALAISIAVSAMGAVFTVVKAYRAPQTETLRCWVLSTIAAAGGVMAVGSLDPVLLAYPVYLCGIYGTICAATLLGRRRQRLVMQASAPVLVLTEK